MQQIVDLWFPLIGSRLPADHGYGLYSAVCGECGELHAAPWWGLHTVPGTRRGDGDIVLSARACMGLRLPPDRIGTVLPLAGRKLDVDGHSIRLAPPRVRMLEPCDAVSARIVTIKGYMEPEPFRSAVGRQLEDLGIEASIQVGPRKVVQIRQHVVVGFSVRATGLTAEESLTIQREGVGGRGHFGCGIFSPSPHPLTPDARTTKAEDAPS